MAPTASTASMDADVVPIADTSSTRRAVARFSSKATRCDAAALPSGRSSGSRRSTAIRCRRREVRRHRVEPQDKPAPIEVEQART